ncbi:MAG: D-alanine--D-alanine ligase [Oscillospiraceae bacterium]|nr:D-alanine--D-alanine ligase [Oscillospiraceae bacterium]
MSKLRIGIVFGGVSSEYEISLISAASVIENIPRDIYDVVLIGITKRGRWLHYPGNTELIRKDEWAQHPDCVNAVISPDRIHKGILTVQDDGSSTILKLDCVFPVMHGAFGEDGSIQGLLALAGIPCVGCDLRSSALCLDKTMTHTLMDYNGISNAPWMSFEEHELSDLNLICEKVLDKFSLPVFVKPANTGSSVGINKAKTAEDLAAMIKIAFTHDKKILVEGFIDGIEVETAALGTTDDCVIAQPGQIVPANEFYDYDSKYFLESKTFIPARITPKTRDEIIAAAKKAFKVLGCYGIARIDFFVTKDDKIVLNELNTIPGFTSISLYARMFEYSGVSYPDLVQKLIELAIERG